VIPCSVAVGYQFEVLMIVKVEVKVFWVVMSCSVAVGSDISIQIFVTITAIAICTFYPVLYFWSHDSVFWCNFHTDTSSIRYESICSTT
jgi:hypothetical protein